MWDLNVVSDAGLHCFEEWRANARGNLAQVPFCFQLLLLFLFKSKYLEEGQKPAEVAGGMQLGKGMGKMSVHFRCTPA